ncbi:hypothetical protein MMC07_008507 [Pseudocyphellaria aurata]|nr:hypothetical protein [Pseudocyphellaria aurata]
MDGRDILSLGPGDKGGSTSRSIGGSSNQISDQPRRPSTQGQETENPQALADDFSDLFDFDYDPQLDPTFPIDPALEPASGVDPTISWVANNQQSEHHGSDGEADGEFEWDFEWASCLESMNEATAQSSTLEEKWRSLQHASLQPQSAPGLSRKEEKAVVAAEGASHSGQPQADETDSASQESSSLYTVGLTPEAIAATKLLMSAKPELLDPTKISKAGQEAAERKRSHSLVTGSEEGEDQPVSKRMRVQDDGSSACGPTRPRLVRRLPRAQAAPPSSRARPAPRLSPAPSPLQKQNRADERPHSEAGAAVNVEMPPQVRAMPQLLDRTEISKAGQDAAQGKRSHSLVAGSEEGEDQPVSKRMRPSSSTSATPPSSSTSATSPASSASRLPPGPSPLQNEIRADESPRPEAGAAVKVETPPRVRATESPRPEAGAPVNVETSPRVMATDYRFVRPSNRREYRLVADALLSARLDFQRFTGFEPPETPEHESYAVQWNMLHHAVLDVWVAKRKPPRLHCLGPWCGGLDNWHGLKCLGRGPPVWSSLR